MRYTIIMVVWAALHGCSAASPETDAKGKSADSGKKEEEILDRAAAKAEKPKTTTADPSRDDEFSVYCRLDEATAYRCTLPSGISKEKLGWKAGSQILSKIEHFDDNTFVAKWAQGVLANLAIVDEPRYQFIPSEETLVLPLRCNKGKCSFSTPTPDVFPARQGEVESYLKDSIKIESVEVGSSTLLGSPMSFEISSSAEVSISYTIKGRPEPIIFKAGVGSKSVMEVALKVMGSQR